MQHLDDNHTTVDLDMLREYAYDLHMGITEHTERHRHNVADAIYRVLDTLHATVPSLRTRVDNLEYEVEGYEDHAHQYAEHIDWITDQLGDLIARADDPELDPEDYPGRLGTIAEDLKYLRDTARNDAPKLHQG